MTKKFHEHPSFKAAHSALLHASERIGAREYAAGRYRGTYRRGKLVRGYTLSDAHQRIQEALNELSYGRITPEEAMAVLHEYDVFHARTGRG